MFGGIAFLVNGAMCVGVDKGDLIVRCGKDETREAARQKGVRELDLSGGRPMKGWLLVGAEATRTAAALEAWVGCALARAGKAKGAARRPAKRRATKGMCAGGSRTR